MPKLRILGGGRWARGGGHKMLQRQSFIHEQDHWAEGLRACSNCWPRCAINRSRITPRPRIEPGSSAWQRKNTNRYATADLNAMPACVSSRGFRLFCFGSERRG